MGLDASTKTRTATHSMHKTLIALLFAFFALSAPAFAQNAAQIEAVRDGAKACEGCNLFQAEFGLLDLSDRDLSGARLRQANLEVSTLDRTNLASANLSVANLYGARMTNANLKNANLRDATLVGVWFGGADLTGADLTGAVISGSYLTTAKGLTKDQLAGAYCDEYTEFPKGLDASMCLNN